MNIEQFAAMAVKEARGRWYIATVDVDTIGPVSIKAYGNWIQRMAWNRIVDGSAHGISTQRDARHWIIETLNRNKV